MLENDREQIAVAGEDRGARDVLLALEPCDQLLRKRSIICAQRRRTDAPDQSGLLSDLPEIADWDTSSPWTISAPLTNRSVTPRVIMLIAIISRRRDLRSSQRTTAIADRADVQWVR